MVHAAELNLYICGVSKEKVTSITICPNPVTDFLNVSIAKKEGNVTYEVISLSGQIIQTSTLTNTHTLDVSGFTKGVYFIRFHRNGNTETFQFIK
ncbi:MAG: T9SS type A sorting domain-containing protein [Oceanihabitans sp.]|nr:T9SS type A sorting domain-containing protein [Oceanihabitans sp.]